MLGKSLIKLGEWLNSRFPEKVNADQVYSTIKTMDESLELFDKHLTELEATATAHTALLSELSKKVEVLTSENTAMKASLAIRTRIASSLPIPGR